MMRRFLRLLLALMLLLIPTSFRFVMSALDIERAQIFVEFRGIVIFAADFCLWLSLIILVILSLKTRNLLARLLEIITTAHFRAWLLLSIWAAISLIWSRYFLLAFYHVYELWLVLGFALCIAACLEDEDWQFLSWAILFFAAIQSMIAVLQIVNDGSLGLYWFGEIFYRDIRAYGLSVNPNNLAGYLLIAWHLGLRLWQVDKLGWLTIPLMGLLLLGCLATASRTVMLALLLSGLGIGFSQGRLLRWLGLSVLLGLLVILLWLSRTGLGFWQRLFFEYGPTWEVILAHPVLGVGMGQSLIEAFRMTQIDYRVLLPAHNSFMVVLAELGPLGLVAYCFGYIQTIRASFKLPRGEILILAWGFLAILFVTTLDYYFWGDLRTRILFFFYLGMLWNRIAAVNRDDKSGKTI